ncbi:hypothetical protein AYI68_g153 [Smittium mucronatum]|uniref:Uncharacterized protein n=1 Tax=Smittium mucronatum TaxID=133383 RepID=A0A1R0H8Z8_9FUNG|nr:hypothetical protein AYI68_g153 [Smittium mucronatum]
MGMVMVMRNHDWSNPCLPLWVCTGGRNLARALSDDLDPSVNLTGEPVMEDLTFSLMDLSLSADPTPPPSKFLAYYSYLGGCINT